MQTIYDFIKEQEVNYLKPIILEDGWNWCMKESLRRWFLYKNSQFEEENDNRYLRPNRNLILGIRNVENRTEGFDVKDIEIYVNDPDEYYKSFLVKKFHEKWALENQIDTFIDEMVDSYGDYGGVLVRDTSENRPEVIDLRKIAFCNQTDVLAYSFGIKHCLSVSQLREMGEKSGWGEDSNGATCSIEDLIVLLKKENDEPKEIDIYEVHGSLPKDWMNDERSKTESKKDLPMIWIGAYYKKQDGNEQGVTLFKKREPKLPFKFLKRDDIKGRSLGRSGIEELVESQKWTNWDEIKVTEMLEAASKMIGVTDDPTFAAKHPSGLKDVDNLEFLQVTSGKKVEILNTYPRNLVLFNDSIARWQDHAQQIGAVSEGLMGESPSSGTPFKLYEAQNIEAKSMHRFRQGQIATFMDEIYRDWILPHLAKEISEDQNFFATLSADELLGVAKNVAVIEWNKFVKDEIFSERVVMEDKDTFIQRKTDEYLGAGNKRFIKILKGELKDKPLNVFTNIAGKQKNLALLTDKLVNVLRQFIATPQIRQDPEMVKLLNVILESSGMSPIMFGSSPLLMQPQQGGSEPLKALGEANKAATTV